MRSPPNRITLEVWETSRPLPWPRAGTERGRRGQGAGQGVFPDLVSEVKPAFPRWALHPPTWTTASPHGTPLGLVSATPASPSSPGQHPRPHGVLKWMPKEQWKNKQEEHPAARCTPASANGDQDELLRQIIL